MAPITNLKVPYKQYQNGTMAFSADGRSLWWIRNEVDGPNVFGKGLVWETSNWVEQPWSINGEGLSVAEKLVQACPFVHQETDEGNVWISKNGKVRILYGGYLGGC